MAEYKPKTKDVALAAMDGVRKLREEFANMRKHIAVIDDIVFKKMHYDTGELNADNDTYNCCPKLDSSIHIELATFAKNKCPHCGSHNLHFTFNPDAFSDSTVNCKDCHNSWKVGGCDEDIDSPYEVANKLRREHCILFAKNADLQEENEKLKQQAAIDASYMVTVEDLMARLKSREERIEALKLDNECMKMSIDEFIKDKKDLTVMIDRLESENEELKNKNKELDKYIDKFFKDLDSNQIRAWDIMCYELNELEKENENLERNVKELQEENEKLMISSALLESDNNFLRWEIDEYKDKIDVLKDERHKLEKKNEELQKEIVAYRDAQYDSRLMKKALNFYQDITTLDVYLNSSTGFISFTSTNAGGQCQRVAVKGNDLDTLCDAYTKFHQYAKKEK